MAGVILHIYDVSTDPNIAEVNKIMVAMGTGAFHGGVEVYRKEWSYGYSEKETGVFCCSPKGCTAHHYRESVPMGETKMTPAEVGKVLEKLMKEWKGPDYDLLRHNCVLFSDALCKELGVGSVPPWVTNLAGAGATLQDGAKQAQGAAIIAAAKAGEINEKYKVTEKAADAYSKGATQAALMAAKAKAQYIELDKQYKIQEKAANAASATQAQATLLAMQACTKASELDNQYHIQENAMKTKDEAWKKICEINEQYKVKEQAGAFFSAGLAKAQEGLAQAQVAVQGAMQQNQTGTAPAQDFIEGKEKEAPQCGCKCQ